MTEAVMTAEVSPEFPNEAVQNEWVDPESIRPDISHIITEDDAPVDNLPSEKNQRLLVEPLYASQLSRPFLAAANVGLFGALHQQPLVPDMMLSLGVAVADDWWTREHRSYFIWEFGKVPDVVIEIVSNTEGNEAGRKLQRYAQWGVPYYVIYDPQLLIQAKELVVYELHVGQYLPRPDQRLPRIDLGLTLWEGVFEDKMDRWLRWCDGDGQLFLTGVELAEQERQRAEREQQRAEQEQQRAEQEKQRAERYAAQLRALGIDPE
ncbi:MAG: Uma2 family endonuclease [Caldilineaceae bacterium]|nr:Uma2 family endonuclease [Caldilineaceae bacterium]